ncbi:MAG TPA: hypothetical protein VIU87_04940 [Mycobacterium sp.]
MLKIFNDSRSACEAYHSLRALDQLASLLTDEQRSHAIEALRAATADPQGVGLMQDAFIPVWIEQVLESMNRGRA